VIKRGFITLGELEKMFHLSQIVLTEKSLVNVEFEKCFESYSNDQWLLCRKQTWLNMANIPHALMLNRNIIDEMILITLINELLKG
jgi:hypothetical protein